MLVKAVVGPRSTAQAHVFESVVKLPKFASYMRHSQVGDPGSFVQFVVPDRINRVCIYQKKSIAVLTNIPFRC